MMRQRLAWPIRRLNRVGAGPAPRPIPGAAGFASPLALCRSLGNQTVQRLLHSGAVQAKLRIGQPGDPCEREADRIADQAMSRFAPCPTRGDELRAACAAMSAGSLERKAHGPPTTPGDGWAPDDLLRGLGPGRTLDAETRRFMETRLHADFAAVRVHTGPDANRSAEEISAIAYTSGRHIVFGAGHYEPRSEHGKRLLAHELTHVVQQGGAGSGDENVAAGASVQRVADKSGPPNNLLCDRTDPGPGRPVGTHVDFGKNEQAVGAVNAELIAAEFAAWDARGRVDRFVIDGFASSEGQARVNWRISCSRAEAVKAELIRLGVPAAILTTVAHGETEEYSATDLPPNRRAVIRIVPATQPAPATGCPGTVTENTTLAADCGPAGIAIAADNVVLDCDGHAITGSGTGNGIELRGRAGVRVTNCHVTNFGNGFALRASSANTFTNNSSFANRVDGFDINDSNENLFIQNDASRNDDHGIELDGSRDNLFVGNTVGGNNDGFDTEGPPRTGPPAPRNRFVFNVVDGNRGSGFRILSDDNAIRGNSSTNNRDGYRIQGDRNTLANNVGSNSQRDGFRIEGDDNALDGNRGSGNQSDDLDVRNNTTGNTCSGNSLSGINGRCPPDFP